MLFDDANLLEVRPSGDQGSANQAASTRDFVNQFDPRLTPARGDLAAKHLEGRIAAERFVAGELREIAEPQTPVRRVPSPEAPLDTEALEGERVTVYEISEEGWAWGQLASDGYVGYLSANALRPVGPALTHKVAAARTLVFPGPSIKLPPLCGLPLGARLAVARIAAPFAITTTGGCVPLQHLVPVDAIENDYVDVAERFLHAPYLWGGKTALGLDCSALVQVALSACGRSCPRDSDLQEKTLGAALAAPDLTDPHRGDLMFWKGHVAIVRDRGTLIHANAFHMAVTVEPIAAAVERIAASGFQLTSVRRL